MSRTQWAISVAVLLLAIGGFGSFQLLFADLEPLRADNPRSGLFDILVWMTGTLGRPAAAIINLVLWISLVIWDVTSIWDQPGDKGSR